MRRRRRQSALHRPLWAGMGLALSLSVVGSWPGSPGLGHVVDLEGLAPVPDWGRRAGRVRVLMSQDRARLKVENSRIAPVVEFRPEGWQIAYNAREGWVTPEMNGLRLEPAPGKNLKLDGTEYRGALEVFVNPRGAFLAINELPLEDYLKGVVPAELGPVTFPELEAQKTQAVAARTYAVAGLGRNTQLGFDLYGDERSQVYKGVAVEHPVSNRAVTATAGRIVVFEEQPIISYYSSTCGGRTASFADTFGRPEISYLKGGVECPDQSSPYSNWERTLASSQIETGVKRYGVLGRLSDVRIHKPGSFGRAAGLLFRGSSKEFVLRGLDARLALGLPSHFLVSVTPERSGKDLTAVRFTGHGFGHGVGLCQFGAVEWARRGKEYSWILQRYYPGTRVAALY